MYAGDERNPRLEIAAHESYGAVFQLKLYQPAENSVNAEGISLPEAGDSEMEF
jgi:hypothetical protein